MNATLRTGLSFPHTHRSVLISSCSLWYFGTFALWHFGTLMLLDTHAHNSHDSATLEQSAEICWMNVADSNKNQAISRALKRCYPPRKHTFQKGLSPPTYIHTYVHMYIYRNIVQHNKQVNSETHSEPKWKERHVKWAFEGDV